MKTLVPTGGVKKCLHRRFSPLFFEVLLHTSLWLPPEKGVTHRAFSGGSLGLWVRWPCSDVARWGGRSWFVLLRFVWHGVCFLEDLEETIKDSEWENELAAASFLKKKCKSFIKNLRATMYRR